MINNNVNKSVRNDVVNDLNANLIYKSEADGINSNTSFLISENSFPSDAKGWVNGVYHPREEQIIFSDNIALTNRFGTIAIPGRVWKETEETGWGIYTYEDTIGLHIPLENGNYDVSVIFTAPEGEPYKAIVKVNNIIKAEGVMIAQKKKEVNFCISVIQSSVVLKLLPASEATTWEEAKTAYVYINRIVIRKQKEKEKRDKVGIFLASDSTVQSYHKEEYPQTGWGQVFLSCFKNCENIEPVWEEGGRTGEAAVYETKDVLIENRAIGGRSTKSFLEEGRLDHLLYDLRPMDYVLVQFGHNDSTVTRPTRYVSDKEFRDYLKYYIDGIKQRNGICVLVTPIARRNCDENEGEFAISFQAYRNVMLTMSKEQNIPLLDLGYATAEYLKKIGAEESKKLFLWVEKGAYPDSKYAEGVNDNTHLQFLGARVFAGILAKLIREYDKDDRLDRMKQILTENPMILEFNKISDNI